MSVHDNERTFAPAELDALEDALEHASADALRLPASLDDGARARIRSTLMHYRAIEGHARSMLLEAEPPAGVLADVLAQARAAVATPAAVPTERRGWLSRLRAVWVIPTLAALGGAAAVAIMVVREPTAGAPASSVEIAQAERRAEPTAAAPSVSTPASEPMPALAEAAKDDRPVELARGEGVIGGRANGPIADARARTKGDEAEAVERDDRLGSETRKTKSEKSGGSAGAASRPTATPGASPPPAPKAPATVTPSPEVPRELDGDDVAPQQRLSRADEARRRGDCAAARVDYDRVVAIGSAKQRARARAGIALCLERAGDDAGARTQLEQARKDDVAIDAWFDAQR